MMKNLEFTPVTSSTIESMAHDGKDKMYVRFKKGAVYEYDNVPVEVFESIVKDQASVGKAFGALVKAHPDKYPYRALPV